MGPENSFSFLIGSQVMLMHANGSRDHRIRSVLIGENFASQGTFDNVETAGEEVGPSGG